MNKMIEDRSEQAIKTSTFSMILGAIFTVAILGYTPMTAKDGRMPITDWLDPMLAGITLVCMLLIQVLLVICWNKIDDMKRKVFVARIMITAQWFYIFGEILSNTITIGEPPSDIGSLFEITGGSLAVLAVIGFLVIFTKNKMKSFMRLPNIILSAMAILLFIGMIWWFTHPIDQSEPGAPKCVPGNPVYNLFHGPCED